MTPEGFPAFASEVSTNDLVTAPDASPPCVGGDIIPILLGANLIVHGPGNEADTIVNTALASPHMSHQRVSQASYIRLRIKH